MKRLRVGESEFWRKFSSARGEAGGPFLPVRQAEWCIQVTSKPFKLLYHDKYHIQDNTTIQKTKTCWFLWCNFLFIQLLGFGANGWGKWAIFQKILSFQQLAAVAGTTYLNII